MTPIDRLNIMIISFKNISKSYLLRTVLENISFDIDRGGFHVLLGENGAGKSTILKIIMGLEKFERGEGYLLGEKFQSYNRNNRHEIGLVSEFVEFDGPFSINNFIKFYSQYFPKWNQELFDQIVNDKKMDLTKKFNKYSRGQKMQIVLATELAKSPSILLLDEITSILDLNSRKYFLNKFSIFCQEGGTIILTTNIISEVQAYATDLIIIKNGHIPLNEKINNVNKHFKIIKIDDDQPIIQSESCIWLRKVDIGMSIYIIPVELLSIYNLSKKEIVEIEPSLSEIFSYYLNSNSSSNKNVEDTNFAKVA
jgi:ABC-2 type transport system ATP-binding protein